MKYIYIALVLLGLGCLARYNIKNPPVSICGPVVSKSIHDSESGHYEYIVFRTENCNYIEVYVGVDKYYKIEIGDMVCFEMRKDKLGEPNCK
jgi:hypothetical protein